MGNTTFKVGVFMDGGFVRAVASAYARQSPGGAPLSLQGVVGWCCDEIARKVRKDPGLVSVVEGRCFMTRAEADPRSTDDIDRSINIALRRMGFVIQHVPVQAGGGAEVCMAVEALDATIRCGLDAVVLVCASASLAPCLPKLAAAGAAVMVCGFDVASTDSRGAPRRVRTSSVLLDLAAWPVMLSREIERAAPGDSLLRRLFPAPRVMGDQPEAAPSEPAPPPADETPAPEGTLTGMVCELRERMGFLMEDWNGRKIFFHFSSVVDPTFGDLRTGDRVEYERGLDPRNRPCAVNIRRISPAPATDEDAPTPGADGAQTPPEEQA